LLCKSSLKRMLATGNWLLSSGNRLPKSETLGKRFFFEKFFWTKLCYSIFWKTLSILILIESSLDSLLESWILIERLFDSWNLLWLNALWFLKLAWLLILKLSLWHHQNNLGKHCFHRFEFWFSISNMCECSSFSSILFSIFMIMNMLRIENELV